MATLRALWPGLCRNGSARPPRWVGDRWLAVATVLAVVAGIAVLVGLSFLVPSETVRNIGLVAAGVLLRGAPARQLTCSGHCGPGWAAPARTGLVLAGKFRGCA